MTDPMELVGRLESNAPLPICPYDRRSPEYWTTNDTDPCRFCGTKNEEGAPDLCRGADTRLFTEAAACIREMVEWRPIETAPRGTDSLGPILVVYGEDTPSYHVAYEGWTEDDGTIAWFNGDVRVYPTHWLPLPPAPGAEA